MKNRKYIIFIEDINNKKILGFYRKITCSHKLKVLLYKSSATIIDYNKLKEELKIIYKLFKKFKFERQTQCEKHGIYKNDKYKLHILKINNKSILNILDFKYEYIYNNDFIYIKKVK